MCAYTFELEYASRPHHTTAPVGEIRTCDFDNTVAGRSLPHRSSRRCAAVFGYVVGPWDGGETETRSAPRGFTD